MGDVTEPGVEPDPFHGPDWGGTPTAVEPGAAPPERRRRRVSLRRLRRRRSLSIAMMIAGAVIVLSFVWLAITALLARGQLQTVRDEVHRLRAQIDAGDLSAAKRTAQAIGQHADRAHALTTGPVWATLAGLPGGEPINTVRVITREVDALGSQVLPRLVRATDGIDPNRLRRPDGSIDVGLLSGVAPTLDTANARLAHAVASVQQQPADTWLGPVDNARRQLLSQLTGLAKTLRSADLAAHIAPAMLGQSGPKRYFVGFQNDAEARGTGGIPGAFAIAKADHGKLTFERFESDKTLYDEHAGIDLGADYDKLFEGSRSTTLYVNSNLSPHFPYAARIWLAMWKKYSGETLDGAIAVDPQTLSYLLRVTGPARLPDGTSVGADNVVALTQSQIYAKFPKPVENDQRRKYLLTIAEQISHRILDSRSSPTALVKAGGRAAGERRLLVYSTDPRVEAQIEQTSLSGAIPPAKNKAYVGLSVVNLRGNKLDYYLDRSMTWQRTGCGGQRQVTVTIKLTNGAPPGLPPYVRDKNDYVPYKTKPGDNRLMVTYYATPFAILRSMTVEGQAIQPYQFQDLGHPVFEKDVELPRGATRTVVLHLTEPGYAGAPLVLRQPLVRPLTVRIADAHCP